MTTLLTLTGLPILSLWSCYVNSTCLWDIWTEIPSSERTSNSLSSLQSELSLKESLYRISNGFLRLYFQYIPWFGLPGVPKKFPRLSSSTKATTAVF